MKNKRVFALILLITLLFTGCDNEKNDTVPMSNDIENQQEETQKEEQDKPDIVDKPEILSFVDVYEAEYQVEINPNVEANPYNPEAFVLNGDRMTYIGEGYSYRLGVDVSKYQGDIDWEKVKNAGMEFAIIRLGFRGYGQAGNIKLDDKFIQNIQGAQNAGLDVGVYFYAQAVNEQEAIEEAQFVLKYLEGYDVQLPVVYDPESVLHDDARTDNVTGEQFTKNTKMFCETIKNAGYEPMIYCNMLWEAYELDLEYLSEYPIWYADYELLPQTPYNFEIWQYTSEGTVDGITGNVDINIQLIEK